MIKYQSLHTFLSQYSCGMYTPTFTIRNMSNSCVACKEVRAIRSGTENLWCYKSLVWQDNLWIATATWGAYQRSVCSQLISLTHLPIAFCCPCYQLHLWYQVIAVWEQGRQWRQPPCIVLYVSLPDVLIKTTQSHDAQIHRGRAL